MKQDIENASSCEQDTKGPARTDSLNQARSSSVRVIGLLQPTSGGKFLTQHPSLLSEARWRADADMKLR